MTGFLRCRRVDESGPEPPGEAIGADPCERRTMFSAAPHRSAQAWNQRPHVVSGTSLMPGQVPDGADVAAGIGITDPFEVMLVILEHELDAHAVDVGARADRRRRRM